MGSGSLSFCGISMDWNDVLADYEGIVCICLWVFVGIMGYTRSFYMQFLGKIIWGRNAFTSSVYVETACK